MNNKQSISFLKKKKKKKKKKKVFDWLNKHLVYYLYMDECDCLSQ